MLVTLFLTGNYHTEIYDTGIYSQNKVKVVRNEQISSFLQHKEAGKMCGHKNIVHYLGFFFLDIWGFFYPLFQILLNKKLIWLFNRQQSKDLKHVCRPV